MKKANQVLYGVFGAVALAYGVSALLFPGILLSEPRRTTLVRHLLQEHGAAGVFIGLMFLWCIINYERRMAVHLFLVVFAFLIAAIHWFDYFGGDLPWLSPLYNTVPFLVLSMMALTGRERPDISPAEKTK